jgi:hypothetical protein
MAMLPLLIVFLTSMEALYAMVRSRPKVEVVIGGDTKFRLKR